MNTEAFTDGGRSNTLVPSTTAPASVERDYTQEPLPEDQSRHNFVDITDRKLALYYESPTLLIALFIGIGALMARRRLGSSNKWK